MWTSNKTDLKENMMDVGEQQFSLTLSRGMHKGLEHAIEDC